MAATAPVRAAVGLATAVTLAVFASVATDVTVAPPVAWVSEGVDSVSPDALDGTAVAVAVDTVDAVPDNAVAVVLTP
jgi:hypothetical protein